METFPRRISSMFGTKKVIPVVWFGLIGWISFILIRKVVLEGAPLISLTTPMLLVALSVAARSLIPYELPDEVMDHGTFFIIRIRRTEIRVDFKDVDVIRYWNFNKSLVIEIQTRDPKLSYAFYYRTPFFTRSPLFWFANKEPVVELMNRVNSAKTQSR